MPEPFGPDVHGLTARTLLLEPDEARHCRRLRDDALRRYLPADALELAALEAVVMAQLKLVRLDGQECAATAAGPEQERWLRTINTCRTRLARELDRATKRLEQLIADRPAQLGATPAQLRRIADLIEAAPPANDDDDALPNEPDAADEVAANADDFAFAQALQANPELLAEAEAAMRQWRETRFRQAG
jgi:hypothetical protein